MKVLSNQWAVCEINVKSGEGQERRKINLIFSVLTVEEIVFVIIPQLAAIVGAATASNLQKFGERCQKDFGREEDVVFMLTEDKDLDRELVSEVISLMVKNLPKKMRVVVYPDYDLFGTWRAHLLSHQPHQPFVNFN